jgi:cyanophycinase-like exopeptidase
LVLIGGGEFSFGETLAVDQAWLERTGEGPVGFLPTASGSTDYFENFADYLLETFDRKAEIIPVYRGRDAKRGKNAERVGGCAAVYVGGGVPDELLHTLQETPLMEAVGRHLGTGGVVVAIAAAAQAFGKYARSLFGGGSIAGFGWLSGGVVEPNFDPGHDRRLRRLVAEPGVTWGLGIPAGSAIMLGPDDQVRMIGTSFLLEEPDGDFQVLKGE